MKIAVMPARPLLLASALFAAAPGTAQTLPGDPVEGRALAREVCAACHQVERLGKRLGAGGAPTFQEVADDPAVTAISLQAFLRTPHETMPNLMLTAEETDDAIAYILSLK